MADSVGHDPPILMALQAEILSTDTSDYFKPIIFLRSSFNSVFSVGTLSSRPDDCGIQSRITI